MFLLDLLKTKLSARLELAAFLLHKCHQAVEVTPSQSHGVEKSPLGGGRDVKNTRGEYEKNTHEFDVKERR